MNRILTLVFIGAAVFTVILFLNRPELLNEIWLWLIGLSGGIIQSIKGVFEYFKKGDKEERQLVAASAQPTASLSAALALSETTEPVLAINEVAEPVKVTKVVRKISVKAPFVKLPSSVKQQIGSFDGTTLTVLRGKDDGATTLGWLYINDNYFCYTLEDTFRKKKIKHKTRIPKGSYTLGFNRAETSKTMSYRKKYDWFTFHLHVKKVSGFTGIYIHSGATHLHTSGCLLVSDSLVVNDKSKYFNNSRNTFKKLYLELSDYINQDTKVRIVYLDEEWIKTLN